MLEDSPCVLLTTQIQKARLTSIWNSVYRRNLSQNTRNCRRCHALRKLAPSSSPGIFVLRHGVTRIIQKVLNGEPQKYEEIWPELEWTASASQLNTEDNNLSASSDAVAKLSEAVAKQDRTPIHASYYTFASTRPPSGRSARTTTGCTSEAHNGLLGRSISRLTGCTQAPVS